MSTQREVFGLVVVCVVIVVLSLAGLAAAFATQLEFDIDGLLLIAVCLMMGGIFSLMLFLIAKEYGWLDRIPFLRKRRAVEVAAGNPSDSAGGQEK
jgi:hypothetical protein